MMWIKAEGGVMGFFLNDTNISIWKNCINPFKDTLLEASSYDLSVGEVYVINNCGTAEEQQLPAYLKPSKTALIITYEKVCLPKNILGICFPPTSIAESGILVLNPGHVDSGFKGKLSLTIINMGEYPYSFEANERIFTILLYKLDNMCEKGWSERHPDQVFENELDRTNKIVRKFSNILPKDFLNLNKLIRTRLLTLSLIGAVLALFVTTTIAVIVPFVYEVVTGNIRNKIKIEVFEKKIATRDSIIYKNREDIDSLIKSNQQVQEKRFNLKGKKKE